MAQQSWDKAGRKSHSGMLPGQGQVAWKGRTNFLDGHWMLSPGEEGRGGGHGVAGAVGSLQPIGQDLERSLNRACPPGTRARCKAEQQLGN